MLHRSTVSEKRNIHPFSAVTTKQLSITYQKSLPEGSVDYARRWQNLTGQLNSHQELCTAKKQKNNLERRRERIHLGASFFFYFFHLSTPVTLNLFLTPRLLGSLLTKRCRGLPDISSFWSTSWVPLVPASDWVASIVLSFYTRQLAKNKKITGTDPDRWKHFKITGPQTDY